MNNSENTPHYYYQRSVQLEQELRKIELEYIKLKNENLRHKEILQSQIDDLQKCKRKNECALLELEQYKQICRAGAAIICRICGSVVQTSEVMEHFVEGHNKDPDMFNASDKNCLETFGSKCFEYIMKDYKESEYYDIKLSISKPHFVSLTISNHLDNREIHSEHYLDEIFLLYKQVSL
ncbi:hypothetical protein ACR3K2_16830 [Cryptosporidium serpentis]